MFQRTRTLLPISKTSQKFVEIINMLASPAPGVTWSAAPPESSQADIKVHSWGPDPLFGNCVLLRLLIAAGPESKHGCYGAVLLFVEGQGPVFWKLCPSKLLSVSVSVRWRLYLEQVPEATLHDHHLIREPEINNNKTNK